MKKWKVINNVKISEDFESLNGRRIFTCICMCGLVFERSQSNINRTVVCEDRYCEFSPPKNSLIGRKLGNVFVKRRHRIVKGVSFLACICSCGNFISIDANKIPSDSTRDRWYCGEQECPFSPWLSSEEKEFRSIYSGIMQRCRNPNHESYKNYGGRGIDIYQEWVDDKSKFFEYIGPRPSPVHSIDRINPDGGYEPGNVKWATPSEQMFNRKIRGVNVRTFQEMFLGEKEQFFLENYNLELELKKLMFYCNENNISLERIARNKAKAIKKVKDE